MLVEVKVSFERMTCSGWSSGELMVLQLHALTWLVIN